MLCSVLGLSALSIHAVTIDQAIADMSSPSEAMVIDPRYDWQSNPKITMYAPRGDAIPSWWSGNRPTWTYGVLSWFTAFEAQGNKATNTRVQLKDLRFYVLSESTRKWSQIDISAAPDVGLWTYPFNNASGGSGSRTESSGGISVKPKYPNFHHGYGHSKTIAPQDVRATFTAMEFRLAVDDAGKPDDRAVAKYVVDSGADYYPAVGTDWSLGYAPGMGNGRMLLATNDWRTATLLVPNKNYGSTLEELRNNPPPTLSTSATPTPTPTPTPAPTPTPTPTPTATTPKVIIAKHSGKCMDVSGLSTLNGAPIIQWSCNGGANQQWTIKDMGNSQYELISKNSGKCLDVTNGSMYDGVAVQQYACSGSTRQLWKMQPELNGYYKFVSVLSGKCLDVAGVSTYDNALIQQWNCGISGGDNQRWMIK